MSDTIGFIASPKRLNVALTRARDMLVTMADANTISDTEEVFDDIDADEDDLEPTGSRKNQGALLVRLFKVYQSRGANVRIEDPAQMDSAKLVNL